MTRRRKHAGYIVVEVDSLSTDIFGGEPRTLTYHTVDKVAVGDVAVPIGGALKGKRLTVAEHGRGGFRDAHTVEARPEQAVLVSEAEELEARVKSLRSQANDLARAAREKRAEAAA